MQPEWKTIPESGSSPKTTDSTEENDEYIARLEEELRKQS
jgi:hypothetical protein